MSNFPTSKITATLSIRWMPHQLGYNLVPKIGIPTSIQVNIMNTQCIYGNCNSFALDLVVNWYYEHSMQHYYEYTECS